MRIEIKTPYEDGDILTPGEIARLFKCDPKTVTRWAKAGILPSFRTPGNHRRFRYVDVKPFLTMKREGRDA